jgi:hypothetical protein
MVLAGTFGVLGCSYSTSQGPKVFISRNHGTGNYWNGTQGIPPIEWIIATYCTFSPFAFLRRVNVLSTPELPNENNQGSLGSYLLPMEKFGSMQNVFMQNIK